MPVFVRGPVFFYFFLLLFSFPGSSTMIRSFMRMAWSLRRSLAEGM